MSLFGAGRRNGEPSGVRDAARAYRRTSWWRRRRHEAGGAHREACRDRHGQNRHESENAWGFIGREVVVARCRRQCRSSPQRHREERSTTLKKPARRGACSCSGIDGSGEDPHAGQRVIGSSCLLSRIVASASACRQPTDQRSCRVALRPAARHPHAKALA